MFFAMTFDILYSIFLVLCDLSLFSTWDVSILILTSSILTDILIFSDFLNMLFTFITICHSRWLSRCWEFGVLCCLTTPGLRKDIRRQIRQLYSHKITYYVHFFIITYYRHIHYHIFALQMLGHDLFLLFSPL